MGRPDIRPLESDYTEEVNLNKTWDDYKGDFFDMLSDFKDMWDGHLGQTKALKLQADLLWLVLRKCLPMISLHKGSTFRTTCTKQNQD